MFKLILSSFYFFLPAYLNNATPPLAKKAGILKLLDKPIDFNKKFMGEPVLGLHKTWRGVFSGFTVGMLTLFLQVWLYRFSAIQKITLLDYQEINVLFFGFLLCGGAIFGDLLFAFVKRRLRLKSGARFLPFDQINYVVGAAIFLTPFYKVDSVVWFALLVFSFFLHIIINRIGYHLNLHKAKW